MPDTSIRHQIAVDLMHAHNMLSDGKELRSIGAYFVGGALERARAAAVTTFAAPNGRVDTYDQTVAIIHILDNRVFAKACPYLPSLSKV